MIHTSAEPRIVPAVSLQPLRLYAPSLHAGRTTTEPDHSGNSQHGTLVGWPAIEGARTADTASGGSRALQFMSGQRVDVPPVPINPAAVSLDAWTRNGASGFRNAWGTDGGGANRLWLGLQNGSTLFVRVGNSVVAQSIAATTNWIHIAVTISGSAVELYANGQPVGSGTGTLVAPSNWSIGATPAQSLGWDGKLDNLAIYDAVLTPAQVAARHAGGRSHNGGLA